MAACTDTENARLVDWVHARVEEAAHDVVPSGVHYFRYWDIRRVVHRIIQCLDYTPQTCLYLAANSNRHGGTGVRSYSTVGYNRNPVLSTAARNGRGGSRASTRSGWSLLVYVVLDKRTFSARRLRAFADEISSIKGLDARVLAIIKFGLEHGAPIRVSPSIFERGTRWFMPSVQQYLSKRDAFVAYAHTVGRVNTQCRGPQSARRPPGPPLLEASAARAVL
jgi:hypothetical protein